MMELPKTCCECTLIEDAYKKIALKNIALKILDKYAVSQGIFLYSFGELTTENQQALKDEIEEYREAIMEAAK